MRDRLARQIRAHTATQAVVAYAADMCRAGAPLQEVLAFLDQAERELAQRSWPAYDRLEQQLRDLRAERLGG